MFTVINKGNIFFSLIFQEERVEFFSGLNVEIIFRKTKLKNNFSLFGGLLFASST